MIINDINYYLKFSNNYLLTFPNFILKKIIFIHANLPINFHNIQKINIIYQYYRFFSTPAFGKSLSGVSISERGFKTLKLHIKL